MPPGVTVMQSTGPHTSSEPVRMVQYWWGRHRKAKRRGGRKLRDWGAWAFPAGVDPAIDRDPNWSFVDIWLPHPPVRRRRTDRRGSASR